ncbi:YeiH family protein [Natronosalvus rutilus]|uniref:Sulfate exporter family transporter n=1 Tax=Natronosalvus rutilus TaxID=2953753 RepID=A0A9E7SV53_9EURY|nr:putative sulfate exporter family transporter [Natronosalvus rutilus]UTF52661.1 putative sulfate exporter family transporter [Natronosalvus rutilus]
MSPVGNRVLPGLVVLAVLGILARVVGDATVVNPLVVAIVLGVLVAVFVGVPSWAEPGVRRYKLLLETGIVLLGASLAVDQLVATGPVIVVLAVAVIAVGVGFTEVIGRLLGIGRELRPLLAAGGSVCGVSAVVAVGSSIDSDESAITYAAGTILLFDAVTLVAFPIAGSLLGVPDRLFGVWAGLSLFSTGPAAAVGFSMSETAGQWATVTKLIRNTFIGVLAVAYTVYHVTDAERTNVSQVWSRFPKFLVGFVLVALLANLDVLDESARASISLASDWLFTLAFVGLGIDLNPRQFRTTGLRPVAVVLAQFVTVTVLVYLAVVTLL